MNADNIKNGNNVELTETENELYDRQIRLWGLESQKRLRTAKILISGLSGLGAEITKNIILSGVCSVKLRDNKVVVEEDFCSQFLVSRDNLGLNRAEASVERARALNPMVDITTDTESLSGKNADYFAHFDVVIVTGENSSELERINDICRAHGIKFFACDVWGTFGFNFADLQNHQYVEEEVKHKVISKPNEKIKTELVGAKVHRELEYPAYSALLNFNSKEPRFQRRLKRNFNAIILLRILQEFRDVHHRDPSYKTRDEDILELQRINNNSFQLSSLDNYVFSFLFAQISPAAAVVGGVVAQEVIKVVTKLEAPHRNVFLFDPQTCCGYVEFVGVN